MVMPWSDFFGRVRIEKDKKQIVIKKMTFLILWPLLFFDPATVHAAPLSPSKPVLAESKNTEFLNLSAFDVDWVQPRDPQRSPQKDIQVGDALFLKIILDQDPLQAPLFASLENPQTQLSLLPPPSLDLIQEGWDLLIPPTVPEPLFPFIRTAAAPTNPAPRLPFVFQVTPLKPGQNSLPSLLIQDANQTQRARTNPFPIEVHSAISPQDPHPEQVEGLEPPIGLPFPLWILGLGLLLFCGFLAAVIYGIIRWQKNKKPLPLSAPLDLRSEDQIALDALQAALNLWTQQKQWTPKHFKEYYFKLSEILKTYLGARYRFDALESTTRELIQFLEERKSIGDSNLHTLDTLFLSLDRVKFTDQLPTFAETIDLSNTIKEWVIQTRRPILYTQESKHGI